MDCIRFQHNMKQREALKQENNDLVEQLAEVRDKHYATNYCER